MKALASITCSLILAGVSGMAQGSILFQNVGPGLNAPIRDRQGNLIPAGNKYTAELLRGTTTGPIFMTPITTTFWVGNGWFGVGQPEWVLQGFAPGSHPFFQVRVWDNGGGTITSYAAAVAAGVEYGSSTAWQLADSTGGLGSPAATPPVPGPVLVGMTGFQLVPESSAIVFLIVGAATLLLRRRF